MSKRTSLLANLALGGLMAALPAQTGFSTASIGGEEGETIQIISDAPTGTVSYEPESQMFYADQRVRIVYGDNVLEADTAAVDEITREAQVQGNVVFEGPEQRFTADSAWYNFRTEEGIARNVHGWDGDFHFQGSEVRRLSENEMLFRQPPETPGEEEEGIEIPRYFELPGYDALTSDSRLQPMMTTSELRNYTIRAREFNLFPDDRVFTRHAVVEVLGVPVMYLPVFTRNLSQPIPWDVRFGFSSLTGYSVSVAYNYRHRLYEPHPVTGEMTRRSAGHLRPSVTWYSKSGWGPGLEYEYDIDFGRHRGRWQTFFIEDHERDDDDRWLLEGASRWEVTDNVVALIGADLVNDPEMYEDFFDSFDLDRGRVAERRAFGALTLTEDSFVARLSADWRDRLSEDKFTNFSEPSDNNDDFTQPRDTDMDGEEEIDDVRFDDDLWGRVSERVEGTFASNQLQLGGAPLFYSWDARAFYNLDAGLNRQRTIDDSRVLGIDVYQSLLWQIQLTDRLTLIVRGGVGAAATDRHEEDFDVNGPYPVRVNNVIFADESSFYTGTDLTGMDGLNDFALDGTEGAFNTELMELDDVDDAWVYGDLMTRLQARLSDALTAYAEWRIRESSGQNLGEFWAEAGQPTFLEDLYAFRLEEHFAEVGLRHRLRRPNLVSSLFYERNLQSDDEIFQGELIQRVGGNTTYRNPTGTFTLGVGGGVQETQRRHPSDSRELGLTSATAHVSGRVAPRHGIWWDQFSVSAYFALDEDKFATFDNDLLENDLDEDQDTFTVSNTVGVKISPVWALLWNVRLTHSDDNDSDDDANANSETSIVLSRDLHDAILSLGLAVKNDSFRSDGDEDNRVEGTVSLRFRRSSQEPIGVSAPELIVPRRRPGEIDDAV